MVIQIVPGSEARENWNIVSNRPNNGTSYHPKVDVPEDELGFVGRLRLALAAGRVGQKSRHGMPEEVDKG